MTFIDISVGVGERTPEWPGDTPFSCRWTWAIKQGASVNVSALTASPHVGTHADAPLHVSDGGTAASDLPLDAFIGTAVVVDVRDRNRTLDWEDLRLPAGTAVERVLLRTGCSIADGRFPEHWPVLSGECARRLLAAGLRLLGVDAPSVDEYHSQALPVHHALFAGNAFILENLDLRDVDAGPYELLAAPMRIEGADAAPVRALLRRHPSR